jgi:diacylglycerol kinase (ATP)
MHDVKLPEKKRFSIVKRAESFTYAGRGIWVFLRSTHNAWIHVTVLVAVVILGFYFDITRTEWLAIVMACGFVLVAEAFNTAIEIDIDLTSPGFHPYAKDTKDVAAGAVFIASLTAAVVGLIVFIPYLITL